MNLKEEFLEFRICSAGISNDEGFTGLCTRVVLIGHSEIEASRSIWVGRESLLPRNSDAHGEPSGDASKTPAKAFLLT